LSQQCWLRALLSLAHAVVTVSFQADQVVSGLSLTFLGTGLALVLGNGLTGQNAAAAPISILAGLSALPLVGPVFL
jgi:simple sugar transport system permease protein